MNIDFLAEISDFPHDLDGQAKQVVDALREYRAADHDVAADVAKLRVIVLATQIVCTAIKDLAKDELPPGAKTIRANVMTADGLQQIDVPVLSDGKTPMDMPFDNRMPLLEAVNDYLDDLDMDGTLRIHADGVTFLPTGGLAVSLMEDEDHMPVCHECNANVGECGCDEDEGGNDE